ncbi:MAG: septum formation initiator family protein [Desulfovibrionaceae bacterium]|nr:septum formation initiator family protein [Desulfovibrionaceae bacterium]
MFSRVFLSVILGIINFTVFFFMIWGQNGLLAFQDLKEQLASLKKAKVELDAQNLRLSHEIRLLKTDQAYQEKMIRQKLRYIRDNELVYIFDE